MGVGRRVRGVRRWGAMAGAGLLLAGLLALPAAPARAQSPPETPPGGPWQLTFDEQFDGAALDGARWVQYEGAQNAEDLNYFSPEDVQVDGGILRVGLQRREAGGKPFTSGGMGTHGKFNQAFGRWEVRAKAPRGTGLAPYVALWPDGPGAGWPPEVDLFGCPAEPRTEAVFASISGAVEAPVTQELSAEVDCAGDFHTYAVEWTPDALRWFVDGVEQGAVTEDVPTGPMAVAMGLTAGGCADPITGCPADDTPLPAFFEVDWVRVWRLDDPSAPQPSAVFTAPPPAVAGDPLADITAALEEAGAGATPGATPSTAAAAQPTPAEPSPTPSPTPTPTAESVTALPVLATTGLPGFLVMALAVLSLLGGMALVVWGRSLPVGTGPG